MAERRQRNIPIERVMDLILASDDEDNVDNEDADSVQLDYDEVIPIDNEADNYSNSDDEHVAEEDRVNNIVQHGRIWQNLPLVANAGRQTSVNVVDRLTGEFVAGIHPNSPLDAFMHFMEEDIEDMVRYTNLEARRVLALPITSDDIKQAWHSVDRQEMSAFIGLHLAAGVNKQNYTNVKRLWDPTKSSPIFSATMTRERFENIRRFFRTDDKQRRDRVDRLSPVRYFFERKLQQFQAIYRCGPHMTIDEQLLGFHGRVVFRQYIPNKPEKYGIKIVWLVDNDTSFVVNGLVYLGDNTFFQKPFEDIESKRDRTTMVTCDPIFNQGLNVTMDNWFTSIPLIDLFQERRTTFVGTMRHNSKGIPPAAKVSRGRPKGDAQYYYSQGATLLSYKDKKSKPILLLSTHHKRPAESNGKPEIVDFYNNTKSGVDNVDHQLSLTSSVRKSVRWTYEFALNLIDITVLNSFILFRATAEEEHKAGIKSRSDFIDSLAESLCYPLMQRRAQLRMTKKTMLALEMYNVHRVVQEPQNPNKRGRCRFCHNDNKYSRRCDICNTPSCNNHGIFKHYAC